MKSNTNGGTVADNSQSMKGKFKSTDQTYLFNVMQIRGLSK